MLFCGFSILISKAETLGEMMDMEEFTSSAYIHSAGPMPVTVSITTWAQITPRGTSSVPSHSQLTLVLTAFLRHQ